MKRAGQKIVGVVAWDFQIAQILDRAGVDIVSVGDSVGTNLWGQPSPLAVTMEEMIIVCKAVCRGVKRAIVSCDLPFGPLQEGIDSALRAAIRLVKGAYNEPADVAFPHKKDVDESFFALTKQMLSDDARAARLRAAFATHDRKLIQRIIHYAESRKLGKDSLEFQMLYGIQREEQYRLASEGWKSIVLIAYGSFWFPWYMRRLAERPANVLFVLRNLFAT